ncbi:DIS3-like exonuclease 2 [Pseudomyrmex gracilis]|uniref:DIS3-like exonuclease 2 n=1 Tax=Pseudomyrmex gracilis TaxID=219809 RepID=UPI0009953E65|nr:DIS3-like exonuclease 2 [Pseudomyrmex gracilis]
MNEQVLQESCENGFNLVSDKERTSNDNQESSSSSSSSDIMTDELRVFQDNEMVNLVAQLSSICTISSDNESENASCNETAETDNVESNCTNVNKHDTVEHSPQLNNVNGCIDNDDRDKDDDKQQTNTKVRLKERKESKNHKKSKEVKKTFENYISKTKIKKLLRTQKPDNLRYVTGNIRINPTNAKYAFLSLKDERDLVIVGLYDRNRALEGDLVVASVYPEKDWKLFSDGTVQKTGKVVSILKKIHPRTAIGVMHKQNVKNNAIIITPRDFRIPRVKISLNTVDCSLCKQLTCDKILFVSIDSWEQFIPTGRILKIVGEVNEINAEMEAIILSNNLDISPYPTDLLQELPDQNYILTRDDMKDREDWRHECVFTIDPANAVDLDDALSCKVLSNGNYEIGIHIADVTHYLEFFSPLDKAVSSRATTVYMPYTAYQMLPEVLCKICSLSSGKDSLTFSVIYEMTPYGDVVNYRFAKTVIRSCCKMSYETVQDMIENPDKSRPEDFLDIKGDYTLSMISDAVNRLLEVAEELEDKRFANGALRLDLPKLRAWLDSSLKNNQESKLFPKFYLEETKDSHKLVREMMLLTNKTVATHLYKAIPKKAFLRIHRDPSKRRLQEVSNLLKHIGIHLDVTTAGTLNSSIDRYYPEYDPANSNSMNSIIMAITNMCSKYMMRAEYVCTSDISSCDLRHYALNMPFYTHFTSPIRRYADCIVHRLLYATITNKPLPKEWTAKLCSKIAFNCNVKKQSAELAQDQTIEVLHAYAIGFAGSFEAKAIVIWLADDKIEVLLCDTALKFKIFFKDVEGIVSIDTDYTVDNNVSDVTLIWNGDPPREQIIHLFSFVSIKVEKIDKELRLRATLLSPSEE